MTQPEKDQVRIVLPRALTLSCRSFLHPSTSTLTSYSLSRAQEVLERHKITNSMAQELTSQAGMAQDAQDIQQVFGAMTLRETFTGELPYHWLCIDRVPRSVVREP